MEPIWASGNSFSIILPTLNEGDNIVPMLEALVRLYPKASIIVVDDHSRDGTPQKAKDFASKGNDVIVVERDPSDKGLTASIFDGILHSKTEFFVVMDADFQHPPASIADLMERLNEGNDMVIGIRENKLAMPGARKLASWGANGMASAYLRWKRQPTSEDTMSGFFGGRTKLCQSIIVANEKKFERKGFKALFDLLKFIPKDAKVEEVQFKFDSRRSGDSKLSSMVILSIMRQCGIWGKTLAILTSFLLANVFGRYIAALVIGLLFTFGALNLTDTILTREMSYSIMISMFLAIGYLVLMNKVILKLGRRDGLIRGIKLVFTGFTGYLVSLYTFYAIFSDITQVQMFALFFGFGIGFAWDAIGNSIKK